MPAVKSRSDMLDLWREYKSAGDESTRNRLMESYLPIVRYNAERISTKLPDEVDVDDLISAGIFGLMDAIDAFDLKRGVKFETYCAPRIRGAILDELRSMDWVPRLVRSRAHKLERVNRALQAELGRQPTEDELAKRMGVCKREYEKIRRDSNAVAQVSLSRKHYETDSSRDICEIDVLEDKQGNLWLGTGGGGITRYNGNGFTHFTTEEGLVGNNIRPMWEDSRGHLWIGTLGGGVSRMRTGRLAARPRPRRRYRSGVRRRG